MKCAHCRVEFHPAEFTQHIHYGSTYTGFQILMERCPACSEYIFWLGERNDIGNYEWELVRPKSISRGAVSSEVPAPLQQDYAEACDVLAISPKASAALSRRCLQTILNNFGYKAKDLAKQIDLLLSEKDASKAIPLALRDTIDGIRNFGNFSAHPITDQTTLQIIDVEPHEAEWCIEILEEMFQHFYARPAEAKRRKALLDAKLQSAGKPPSK